MWNMYAPVGSVSSQLIVNYGNLRSGTKKLRSPNSLDFVSMREGRGLCNVHVIVRDQHFDLTPDFPHYIELSPYTSWAVEKSDSRFI
jgi:hypothetical protein